MLPYERGFFIARIKSGFVRLKHKELTLKYKIPKDLVYESEEVYFDVYQQSLESGVATEQTLYKILMERKLWDESKELSLTKTLPTDIENIKVEMFNLFHKPNEVNRLRLYLNRAKKEIVDLFDVRHQFDYLSCGGAALYSRWQFIVENSVTVNGQPLDFNKIHPHDILSLISNSTVDESIIRDIARNEPWQTTWIIAKKFNNLFDCCVADYSEDQKRLVSWSLLYDNIKDYDDCPSEEIIMDDDCFDGWMVLKRREQKAKTQADKLSGLSSKHANAQEIFIPVKNQYNSEGINPEDIFSLNNPLAKSIIESRIQAVAEHGEVKLSELPDIKMSRGMELNNSQINAQKRK